MKFIVLLCLIGVALSKPTPEGDAQIISSNYEEGPEPGQFRYAFQTDNGITEERSQDFDGNGWVQRGSYSFPLPDGTVVTVTFNSGIGGFRAESPIIPATPEHSLRQIEFAAAERARGVEWDDQGFVL